jgi:hypothetical protein
MNPNSSAPTNLTAPVEPAIGESIAGAWIVQQALTREPRPIYLAHGVTGDTRAALVLLDDADAEPSLSPQLSDLFGTTRRVLRDERFGRVVVDEIPQGPSLAERLSSGQSIPLGVRGELQRRLREAHHADGAHGALQPELIILGVGELAIAGWGLDLSDRSAARARDTAALSALLGRVAALSAGDTGVVSGDDGARSNALNGLRAAIVSDHLPTLRRAFESWNESGGDDRDPDVVRARDALTRLEAKVAGLLSQAERLLESNDVLGATAVCREAIRLGAEDQAEPLLKRARRQAKSTLSAAWYQQPRYRWGAAAIAVVLVVLFAVVRWSIGNSEARQRLAAEVDGVARREGARQAAVMLFGMQSRQPESAHVEQLLAEQLQQTAAQERARLVALRNTAVEQGGRPLEADEESQRVLRDLEQIAASALDTPGLATQFQRALIQVERVAAMYQVSSGLSAEDAAAAVDALLADDAAFGPGGGS